MTVLPKDICAKTPNMGVALSFNDSKVLAGKKNNKLNCFLLGIPNTNWNAVSPGVFCKNTSCSLHVFPFHYSIAFAVNNLGHVSLSTVKDSFFSKMHSWYLSMCSSLNLGQQICNL